jgi:peroxiredoxin
MNKNVLLILACSLPLALLAQGGFTIRGKIGTLDAPAKAILSYSNNGVVVKDSVILHKGNFVFKGKLDGPTQAGLTVKHDTASLKKGTWWDSMSFYIENSNISITAPDSVKHATVKGSLVNDESRELDALLKPVRDRANAFKADYYARTPEQRKDTTWLKSARAIMAETGKDEERISNEFIASHRNSYIALVTFKRVGMAYNFNPELAAAEFAKFTPAMQSSALGKKIATDLETGRKTNVGVTAMDFVQNDVEGKPVKLSDYRGKYVLVDFWASWCAPCRAENPNLVAAYKKYKEKNFTILSVSIDDSASKKAWLRAVEKDSLPWTQVSDLKGWKNDAAVLYGVSAVPSNFLVDPSGKIIARNVRGGELEKKLALLF